jgi:hypothetical protein
MGSARRAQRAMRAWMARANTRLEARRARGPGYEDPARTTRPSLVDTDAESGASSWASSAALGADDPADTTRLGPVTADKEHMASARTRRSGRRRSARRRVEGSCSALTGISSPP